MIDSFSQNTLHIARTWPGKISRSLHAAHGSLLGIGHLLTVGHHGTSQMGTAVLSLLRLLGTVGMHLWILLLMLLV